MKVRYSHSHLAQVLTLLGLLASFSIAPAFADESKENLVKAAFIFNFTKFVDWQGEKAINKQSKIDICVLGDSGIIKNTQVFSQSSSSKLSLSLVHEQNVKNVAAHCHMVFISASEEGRIPEILSVLKNQPVLTISDGEGFIERGGMIGFIKNDARIRLEINKSAVESAGLKIDAQLLEIAFRVIDK
jgi:hypothetical protein